MLRLELHDVDVFALANSVATRSNLQLSFHDREDLVTYLAETAWQLSLTYDRARRKAGRTDFAGYLTIALRRRVIDWQRQRFGRTKWAFKGYAYERPRPELVSLDDGDDRDQLGATVDEGSSAHAPGWDSGLGGILREADSSRARDADTLGLRGAPRAAG